MAALDAVFLRAISPAELLGLESYFLEAVRAEVCPPILMLHELPGRVVSIGRYHLYDGAELRGGVAVYRRLTGGRVAGAGNGWLGCVLILPARDALLGEQTAGLRAEQVMNRYVRGALSGLRVLGLDCFYPGRDAVTCNRRELAMCSFETDARGGLLFELHLAVNRGMDALVYDLEQLDPDGALVCPIYTRDAASSVVRELSRELGTDELVDAIIAGYGSYLGGARRRELTGTERSQGRNRGVALATSGWLNSRKPDPLLDKVARSPCQLGFVEAHCRLGAEDRVERVMLAGDFIANSSGVEAFENELVSKRMDPANVTNAAIRVYGDESNYILGIGELVNLSRLLMKVDQSRT